MRLCAYLYATHYVLGWSASPFSTHCRGTSPPSVAISLLLRISRRNMQQRQQKKKTTITMHKYLKNNDNDNTRTHLQLRQSVGPALWLAGSAIGLAAVA